LRSAGSRDLYALVSGADAEQVNKARAAVDAGFEDVNLFFAAFTWRGWIAHA